MNFTPEQTVLVDMDGVTTNFGRGAEMAIHRAFPELTIIENRPTIYFRDIYPEHAQSIQELVREPNFTRNLLLIDGALEGWATMQEAGFHPRICSAPLDNTPLIRAEKLGWLEEHFVPRFGHEVIDRAIIDKNKLGYDAIALIDDRGKIKGSERAMWQHIIFSQSYNLGVPTEFRLNDWHDPSLLGLLTKAQYNYRLKRGHEK